MKRTTAPRAALAAVLVPVLAAVLAAAACLPAERASGPRPSPTQAATTPAPQPSPTPSPTARSPVATATTVEVFLVALGDEGRRGEPFGCGDSIVPIERTIPRGASPFRAAVQELLDDRIHGDPTSGELYNVFSESKLTIERVAIDGGLAIIRLTGELRLRGICDDPRVQEQLEKTALQFPGVRSVSVFINGVPLSDLLSER